ncbi:MAG: ABC transporter ATP-binding protein [Prolixibacteraceae bacterium]|jgi:lipopolysaccharide transport system ATP-binding protein|nr:ABC transporter ATP-binding protein [Prolixibacteraceae bacterium]
MKMSNIAIKFENISKQYRLGTIGSGTLSHDLNRWWTMNIRGKEDPNLKIGQVNDRAVKSTDDYVWALRSIDFEVKQGEVLGIIGKNGAGKSTLLKILSRVTNPTTGRIMVTGRIASLLEVGTGFHPEMTGRENIYMNGSIMGMTKAEITRKLDEIIDFSGVEKYIDTPVKRYSSGMTVRLGFAIAAHLEPEILVVDEVLAVGDAEFQKKAIGKMQDVSRSDGRTVLFVSHNMGAIKELCKTAILLKNGQISTNGTANDVVREYLSNPVRITSQNDLLNDHIQRRGNGEVRFIEIAVNNDAIFIDPAEEIRIKFKAIVNTEVDQIYFSLLLKSPVHDDPIANTGRVCLFRNHVEAGTIINFEISIVPNTFRTGLFPMYLWLGKEAELAAENYPFDVVDSVYYLNLNSNKSQKELGYKSDQPGGYFNLNYKIENLISK